MIKRDHLLITLILFGGLFLRWYRLDDLLGFYYDQGRDALAIHNFIVTGKPFLVGPVTGLEGIFLGPMLYYLLTPFYWLASGNPVLPAMFMGSIHIFTIYLLYRLGLTVSKLAGLLAAFVYSFSWTIIGFSRWLSNPPPVMLFSVLLAYSFLQITQGKTKFWLLAVLSLAAGLQFEIASAAFFIPAIIIFLLWEWRHKPTKKIFLVSSLIFFVSLFPQILFELRHQFVMTQNIFEELFSKPSFQPFSQQFFTTRLELYLFSFGNKLFSYHKPLLNLATSFLLTIGLLTKKYWLSPLTKIILIIIFPQLILLLFYHGNYGNVYDYHFSGSFPLFILLVAIWLSSCVKFIWGKFLLIIFLFLFIYSNITSYSILFSNSNKPDYVILTDQIQAVDWIYKDTGQTPFNVDVYVPPVIPYSYEYLFLWRGQRYSQHPENNQLPRIYTLYEPDLPNPDRLVSWLLRQYNIGKIEETAKFGPITVERRSRISDGQ